MKHKLLRGLVALVLVCVLVVSWSPVQVRATGAAPAIQIIKQTVPFFTGGAASGGVALGSAVFGYVAAGLGVVIGGALLSDLVERYQEYSGELDVSIYYYPDGTWSYGVDMGFVERVRTFLFGEGILVDKLSTIDPNNAPSAAAMAEAQAALYAVLVYKQRSSVITYDLVYSNESPVYAKAKYADGTGIKIGTVDASATLFSYNAPTDTFSSHKGVAVEGNSSNKIVAIHMIGSTAVPEYDTTIDGAELGIVAPPEVAIPEAYPDWYANVRYATDADTDDEKPVLPIPLKPKADSGTQSESVTQPDVWQGSIEEAPAITPPEVVPDTVGLADILQLIKGIPAALADVITGPIVGGLTKIGDLIKSIPQAISEAISAIFVPREDFLTAKWEAIRSEFAFADSITSSGQLILDVLNRIDPEPPVIYIDLGASEGSYDIGGEVAFIDLHWYERYKPTGDAIISAFLWLVFIWRMFMKLPGIISGMPGDFVMQGVVDLGLSERLPSRKKEYEYERQQNRRSMRK